MVALLAAHVVLAWMALQAMFVFVELAWRTAARRDEYRALLGAHLRQFQALRAAQLALWVVGAIAFVLWAARAHANLPGLGATGFRYAPRQAMRAIGMTWRTGPTPVSVRWWWGLLVTALSAETLARGLALWSGRALDLGPAMQALVVAQLLTAAAAVVGIAVMLGVHNRHEAAAWPRASGPEHR